MTSRRYCSICDKVHYFTPPQAQPVEDRSGITMSDAIDLIAGTLVLLALLVGLWLFAVIGAAAQS
jgi:hypothetical protein